MSIDGILTETRKHESFVKKFQESNAFADAASGSSRGP